MKIVTTVLFVLLRLFLGGMMVYEGAEKFSRPMPSPTEVVAKAEKFTAPEKEITLQKVLYINGMKQTGFAWELLAVCEILFGLLLVLQGTGFLGAVLLAPITIHIFLFHLFLEADETGELVMTGALLMANLALIAREYPRWKHLLWLKRGTA